MNSSELSAGEADRSRCLGYRIGSMKRYMRITYGSQLGVAHEAAIKVETLGGSRRWHRRVQPKRREHNRFVIELSHDSQLLLPYINDLLESKEEAEKRTSGWTERRC
jgi:hypothetical protein